MALLFLLILFGCVNEKGPVTQTPAPENTLHSHRIFEQWATQHNQTLPDATTFFLNRYGLTSEEDIYDNLPTPIETGATSLKRWDDHNALKLLEISPDVYTQPEFYPTFAKQGVKWWIEADGEIHATTGLLTIPAEQEAEILPEESNIEAVLFVGGAWGATYYQGVGFTYDITPQTPHHLEFDPSSIVVGPTFPQFAQNWVERIHVTGTITPQPGVDTYTIHIRMTNPNTDAEQNWNNQYSPYIRASPIFGDTDGLATLTLHIKTNE
jgi:hypothetical protein